VAVLSPWQVRLSVLLTNSPQKLLITVYGWSPAVWSDFSQSWWHPEGFSLEAFNYTVSKTCKSKIRVYKDLCCWKQLWLTLYTVRPDTPYLITLYAVSCQIIWLIKVHGCQLIQWVNPWSKFEFWTKILTILWKLIFAWNVAYFAHDSLIASFS
jgi:hypothetical protein